MEMIKVGICLDDMQFAHALSQGLARECRNMTFFLFNRTAECHGCDLILSSEPSDDPRSILMVRDGAEENIYGGPPYCVFRYKESHRLVNDLLFIYFEITGKNLEFAGDAKCRILVFASISGGCGCTATALSVGQMLYKLYGAKCLYLNLCPINDSLKYISTGGTESLLRLLYYLDIQKDFPLKSFISPLQHIDAIQTNLLNTYFDEISLELLDRLVNKVDELGEYSFLIFDISNHFSRTNKKLLRRAFRMVLLYQERDQISEPFFLAINKELERFVTSGTVLRVRNFVEDYDDAGDGNDLLLSKEKTMVSSNQQGLLDLSGMMHFQREAAMIAKNIMEEQEV